MRSECQPDQYNKSNTSQFENAICHLHKLNLTGSEKILDVGSGDGRLSSYIAQKGVPDGQLVGIDKSREMVSFAVANNHDPHVSYECIDVLNYHAPHEYDAIVSFWTLHWIELYAQALIAIRECLKEGGKALICHGVGAPLFRTIAEALLDTPKWNSYKKDAQLLTYYSLSYVTQAIEQSGLIIEHLEVIKNGFWMPKEDIIQNWLSLSMFDFIPEKLRQEFCQEILGESMRHYPPNEHGEIFRWAPAIVMVLKKQF